MFFARLELCLLWLLPRSGCLSSSLSFLRNCLILQPGSIAVRTNIITPTKDLSTCSRTRKQNEKYRWSLTNPTLPAFPRTHSMSAMWSGEQSRLSLASQVLVRSAYLLPFPFIFKDLVILINSIRYIISLYILLIKMLSLSIIFTQLLLKTKVLLLSLRKISLLLYKLLSIRGA